MLQDNGDITVTSPRSSAGQITTQVSRGLCPTAMENRNAMLLRIKPASSFNFRTTARLGIIRMSRNKNGSPPSPDFLPTYSWEPVCEDVDHGSRQPMNPGFCPAQIIVSIAEVHPNWTRVGRRAGKGGGYVEDSLESRSQLSPAEAFQRRKTPETSRLLDHSFWITAAISAPRWSV